MLRIILFLFAALTAFAPATAQDADLNALLETYRANIEKPSRTTIGPVLEELIDSQLPAVPVFLEKWREKEVWQRESDGRFFFVEDAGDGKMTLIDVDSGAEAGLADKSDLDNLKPNSGVRGVIAGVLVQFQLSDPDPERRLQALTALERDPEASHLSILRGAIESETDPAIKARKERLQRLLTIQFGSDQANRVAAIESFAGDPGVDARAALNPLLATRVEVFDAAPEGLNVARLLTPGSDIEPQVAYQMLVDAGKARPVVPMADRKQALIDNIENGMVAGIPVAELVTQAARDRAYLALAADGSVPPLVTPEEQQSAVANHVFAEIYAEEDHQRDCRFLPVRRSGARRAVAGVDLLPRRHRACHHLRGDGRDQHGPWRVHHDRRLYRLCRAAVHPELHHVDHRRAAAGLHVTFMAGVAMERLVIRWLYHRPLETLLATFGISIALQQIAEHLRHAGAPLTPPSGSMAPGCSMTWCRSAISASRSSSSPRSFWACCCSFSTARGSGLRCGR
jgi:urea transport system permease protein